MPTLKLSDEQVFELVEQLPREQREKLFQHLVYTAWPEWAELAHYGADRIRKIAAERGKNWDVMTEEEREIFVDDLVHEDRA